MNIQQLQKCAQILGVPESEIIILPMTQEELIAVEQANLQDNDEEEDFEPKEVDEFMEQEAPQAMEKFDNSVYSCFLQSQTI